MTIDETLWRIQGVIGVLAVDDQMAIGQILAELWADGNDHGIAEGDGPQCP